MLNVSRHLRRCYLYLSSPHPKIVSFDITRKILIVLSFNSTTFGGENRTTPPTKRDANLVIGLYRSRTSCFVDRICPNILDVGILPWNEKERVNGLLVLTYFVLTWFFMGKRILRTNRLSASHAQNRIVCFGGRNLFQSSRGETTGKRVLLRRENSWKNDCLDQ